jgi:hypothetical protein
MRSLYVILTFLVGLGPLFAWTFNEPLFEKYFGSLMHKLFGYDVLNSTDYIHTSIDFITGFVWFLFVVFIANCFIRLFVAIFAPREEAQKEELKVLSPQEKFAADAYMRAEMAQLRRSRFKKQKVRPFKA